ncbi:prepilin-type N-terminal cleavage/methylation domain-containing protein [Lysobacter sp. LF1]|uniref:Prepilin-type N-terminal cleavage/methylation domain-containing protein n=1 Tax=Lysobacter stagni TaxID=3045172 RepID=A0ABT6XIP0_9GAMM|nr:prepilin-type N-terminal cleavage/methylation domain-containing protein [Lysobacter sp. LF1]MDI9239896.1 prepilin-type N-terminal cleavage/methylation domain-containing protein [Lysobacter sp. LF1]
MRAPERRQRGFSLIELMVSLLIGLIVIGGAASLFISNRQTSRTAESLSRMQETARIAFEMMSRDIREAAGNPCAKMAPVANVINNSTQAANWWANWGAGILGYDNAVPFPGAAFGSAVTARVSGTDAIEVKSGAASPGFTVVAHTTGTASIQLNTATHGLVPGDAVMICDYAQVAIGQINDADSASDTVILTHGGGEPGNCSMGLGFPTDCGDAIGNAYQYRPNSVLTKLSSVRWYIGNNGRGGRSLYRGTRSANEEIAENVSDLQLTYLVGDNHVASTAVTSWADVAAVEVAVTVVSSDRVAVGNQTLNRTLTHIVAIRNRTP